MGRATVRTAIQSYLQGAGISYLGKVMAHAPKWTEESDFTLNGFPGQGSGVVVYIHLRHQSEFRAALGGPTSGIKFRPHKCVLICLMNSKKKSAEECDADNDTFIDSLVSTIEANRNAGDPKAVFQWGEGDSLYGVDIVVDVHMPRPIRMSTFRQFSLVEVTVLEQVST